jgi:tetratricopeptide (TPR) repeat protein
LDPLAPGRRTGYAIDALAAREYEAAIREAEVALSLEGQLTWPREIIGQSLLLLGRADECAENNLRSHLAIWAICLREVGRVEEAEAAIDSTAALLRGGGETEVSDLALLRDLTAYHAWTGQVEEAVQWLEAVFRLSPFGLDYRVLVSGLFDRVLEDARFRSKLEELQQQAWDRVFRSSLTETPGSRG